MLLCPLMLTPVNRRYQPPGTGKYPTHALDPATRVAFSRDPLRALSRLAPAPHKALGLQAWVGYREVLPVCAGPIGILLARFAEGGTDLVEVLQDLPV
jgi:hypothetical protein